MTPSNKPWLALVTRAAHRDGVRTQISFDFLAVATLAEGTANDVLTLRPMTPGLTVEEAPWVCWSLVAANVAIHSLLFQDREATHSLGFAPRGAGIHTILTSMFVHGS